jgi:hypothetical protein
MISKDSRVNVTDITYNLIFGVTDTGLSVTASIIDLMCNPEIYRATPEVPGIAYKVPIYDDKGIKQLKSVHVIPFTRQGNDSKNKSYCIVNKGDNTVLSWTFQFEKDTDNAIQFLTNQYAREHIATVYNNDSKLEVVDYDEMCKSL